jgi:hypothetical protein
MVRADFRNELVFHKEKIINVHSSIRVFLSPWCNLKTFLENASNYADFGKREIQAQSCKTKVI